ncbi:MAG: elongation factor G [Candidatus Omnitrophica bacterium]|nr:elongation factor G [Candidatus Omnitrophota bacterium]MDD5771209.1 elongation factor G [Candidatus Omnitrophota bacterium]
MDAKNKRNFILLGHAQSGKTTLAESILYLTKAVSRKGKVEEGSTVSDYSFDEIERKTSINLSLLFCDYEGCRVQFIDTPGYADFSGEAISGLRAVDSAIIVVDAASGVQVGTERAWQMAEEAGLPCMIFINKTDKEGVDVNKVLADLKSSFSKNCVIIKSLEDPLLMEAIAESDDTLLEKYLAVLRLSLDEIKSGLAAAVGKRKLFPVIAGSALREEGVKDLLDDILQYCPSPLNRSPVVTFNPLKTDEMKEVALKEDAPFSAFVFKNTSDPYVGQFSLLRIFSGTIAANSSFYNVNKKAKERLGQINMLQGKEQRSLENASCGDIVAIPKLKETVISDSLSQEKEQFLFEPLVFPEPAISSSVKVKSREDEEKIAMALHKLTMDDPTFRVAHNTETKELIISGLGDLHIEVMVARMKKRFNVSVELGTPKISYKETITKSARVQGKFKRQSGGRGQYGDCTIEVQPLERGKGLEFVDKIFGGAIPRNFIPSVEKGVRQAASEGAVAGYPIQDIRVTLVDGSYHEVDSSDMAFQIAGAMALRKAVSEAGPALLEPIMEAEVSIPEECLGAITGDINSRRGRIIGMEIKGKTQIVRAQVPLSEMFKYSNDLRSITAGRGAYLMHLSHYESLPQKLAAPIINQYQASKKHEEVSH